MQTAQLKSFSNNRLLKLKSCRICKAFIQQFYSNTSLPTYPHPNHIWESSQYNSHPNILSLITKPLCEGFIKQTFSILDSIITYFLVHCEMLLVLFLLVFYYGNCPPAAVTTLPAASWCLSSFSIPKEKINKLQVTLCILTVLQG